MLGIGKDEKLPFTANVLIPHTLKFGIPTNTLKHTVPLLVNSSTYHVKHLIPMANLLIVLLSLFDLFSFL